MYSAFLASLALISVSNALQLKTGEGCACLTVVATTRDSDDCPEITIDEEDSETTYTVLPTLKDWYPLSSDNFSTGNFPFL